MVTITLDAVAARLGGLAVLRGISARFEGGAVVGVIGPNGAGKSTLIRAMLGLVPLASGTVRIDDMSIDRLPRRALARDLAYLPQGQTLHWPLTVERVVALGRLPHLAPMSRQSAEDRAAIEAALARAELLDLRDRIATELSGGERARLMLARALAVQAPALIADEPLAALDPAHQIHVMELLAQEARAGTLVIAVLHDLTMAARYCDRLLLLDQGRLIADGAPAEVLSADRLAAAYGIAIETVTSAAGPVVVPLGRVGGADGTLDRGEDRSG